jgi:hypothetical protein
LVVVLSSIAISSGLLPRLTTAAEARLVVDVVAVAEGYRASKLMGTNVLGAGGRGSVTSMIS